MHDFIPYTEKYVWSVSKIASMKFSSIQNQKKWVINK